MRLAYVAYGLGLSALLCAEVRASGLVMPTASAGSAGAGLGPLRTLSIEARLGPGGAEITERRGYALAPDTGTVPVTFYGSAGGTQSVTIGGKAAIVTTFAPADADAVRRRLVRELHDPAPLRQLGGPMVVTDPIEIAMPLSGTLEVVVTTHLALAAHGTLSGVVLPIDWARPPVDTVDVKVSAQTDAPLRVLYSPYHELVVVRDAP